MSSGGFREQRRADELEQMPYGAPAHWTMPDLIKALPSTAYQMGLGALKSGYDFFTAPGRVVRGELDPMSDEGIEQAANMAGGAILGPAAAPAAELNALYSGIRRRPGIGHNSGAIPRVSAEAAPVAKAAAPAIEPALAPQFAERYPEAGGWEWRTDPKKPDKGPYQGKVQTAEEQTLMAARKQAEKGMAGGYTPYFDPEKRTHVDPANYPTDVDTVTQARAALPKTQARYEAMAQNPEGHERLRQAFQQGLDHADVKDWYAMKQLEDEFVSELGPEAGRKAFQEKFANAMSATTAGAAPKENLLMAMYGNYQRRLGNKAPLEGEGYKIPSPMGGQYANTNLQMHLDPERSFKPFDIENPKRHDFEYSFLGHDKAVIDKQMMQLFDPKLDNPAKGYGHYSEVMGKLAEEYGVSPQEFQAIAWMGSKATKEKSYVPHPMISTVNDAIERTRRVSGLDPKEIVRRGIVRSEIPIYSRAIPGIPIPPTQAPPRGMEGAPMPTWMLKKLTGSEEGQT